MKRYKHGYFTLENYNKYVSNKKPTDSDWRCCVFWDIDKVLPEKESDDEYYPVAVMYLKHLPPIGTYLNFNKVLYVITAMCMTSKDDYINSTEIYYDFEVEKVEEGKIKTVL